MDNIKEASFDKLLITVIREAYNGQPLLGGYNGIKLALDKKDIVCTLDEVKESIARLMEKNLLSHKWTGSYYETVPILDAPKVNIVKKKKEPLLATPIVYRFYDLFKDFYHDGNFVKMEKLSDVLKVSTREIRNMKRLFNTRGYSLKNGNTFKRKILGNNQGYTMISTESEKKEARWIIINRLLEAVDELKIYDEDMGIDDQLRADMRTMELKITKSISNDLIK